MPPQSLSGGCGHGASSSWTADACQESHPHVPAYVAAGCKKFRHGAHVDSKHDASWATFTVPRRAAQVQKARDPKQNIHHKHKSKAARTIRRQLRFSIVRRKHELICVITHMQFRTSCGPRRKCQRNSRHHSSSIIEPHLPGRLSA